jgi:predicted aldo/keto reductase-like oxidoreductase
MFSKSGAKINHMLYNGIMTDDGKSHFANTCIECGKCEAKCPQHIEIRKELKFVTKTLEGPIIKGVAATGRVFIRPKKK